MGKILIAYYSRADENYLSGRLRYITKGNTQELAEMIHELNDGDLFKIDQKIPYSKEYNACIEEAKEDLHSNARPELKNYLDGIDEYDDIYLGYPIYWGTFPMAVFTFLERYDFAGKTIHPFITHEGSGKGSSIEDLKRLCPKAKIVEPLVIHGTYVEQSEDEVDGYVKKG